MNRQQRPSPVIADFVNEPVVSTEPPAAPLLNWMYVIYQSDRTSEELDFEHEESDATYATDPLLA